MFEGIERKLGTITKALVLFYSRIILKKKFLVQRDKFKSIEKVTKSYLKSNADLIFL